MFFVKKSTHSFRNLSKILFWSFFVSIHDRKRKAHLNGNDPMIRKILHFCHADHAKIYKGKVTKTHLF